MTSRTTTETIQRIEDVGHRLGLVTLREVSAGAISKYSPVSDVVFASKLSLHDEGFKFVRHVATCAGFKSPLLNDSLLPLVGFEVEGTDPTTKTMLSDLINLVALRYPLGVLVVDSMPTGARKNQGDIYRRATKIARTIEQTHGRHATAVIDCSQLKTIKLPTKSSPEKPAGSIGPQQRGGGDDRTRQITKHLFEFGKQLGFVVWSDCAPERLQSQFTSCVNAVVDSGASLSSGVATLLGLTEFNLLNGTTLPIHDAKKAFTFNQIDLVYAVPAPAAFATFHQVLVNCDPYFGSRWPTCPGHSSGIRVIQIEIDSKVNKHTGGSLLNLGKDAMLGILVVPDQEIETARRLLETYRMVSALGPICILGMNEALSLKV